MIFLLKTDKSISLSIDYKSDENYFESCFKLRINFWDLGINEISFEKNQK